MDGELHNIMDRACVVSSFDMVNVADLDLLGQVEVRHGGDRVVVGVLDDELVRQLHGRPPVVGEQERVELVSALRAAHEVALVHDLAALPAGTTYTDDQRLAGLVDEVIVPMRRSSSPQLLAALAPAGEGAA